MKKTRRSLSGSGLLVRDVSMCFRRFAAVCRPMQTAVFAVQRAGGN